ncbi:DUF3667 domain-containing protein [Corallibacter sp.]|uniref:DUF3667 domain-containing protein n=1 Tax=Corallibacter sp. TaxID=2038084 RepID=UPI003AB5F941
MTCKNCKNALHNNDDYCNKCGAKVIRNRLTLNNLFIDVTQQYFNVDNKFFKTFTSLFSKPEIVIDNYISGTRKKYVNVVSYFAIALTIAGFQMFILNKFFPELLNMDFLDQEGMEGFQQKNMDFSKDYQGLIFMLAVPIYALISKVVFFNHKKYNYTEHLVINMYTSAHFSIISSLFIIITSLFGIHFSITSSIVIIFQVLFTAYCFKRLYQIKTSEIALKTFLFILILIFIMFVVTIVMGAFMYLNGDLQKMIEAKKSAKEASQLSSQFFLF